MCKLLERGGVIELSWSLGQSLQEGVAARKIHISFGYRTTVEVRGSRVCLNLYKREGLVPLGGRVLGLRTGPTLLGSKRQEGNCVSSLPLQKPLLSLEETLNVTERSFHQLVALLHCRSLHKVLSRC